MPPATLAFSITAHERIDVLRGQVLNILHFCVAPIIILHVSAAFRASINADPAGLSMFRRIEMLPGVIVNPAHLPTKWAHMFHAHVANIHYLEKIGAAYSHLVLCSSADLFFRHGVEAHVAEFDAGLDSSGGRTRGDLSAGFWDRPLEKDNVLWRMLDACGSNRVRQSWHEGTFYRRDLLLAALAVIDAHVTDWDYDDRYPKEEFFLPSLVPSMAPEARFAPRLSHVLGFGNGSSMDRLAVRHALRALGAGGTPTRPLADWLTDPELDAQAPPLDLQSRFMLARLVRSATDPLRHLVTRLAETLPISERIEICDRVDCFDLLGFDMPGKQGSTKFPVMSGATSGQLAQRPTEHLLTGLNAFVAPSVREIEPCPVSYLPPLEAWLGVDGGGDVGQLKSCAARIAVAGVRLTLAVDDGALTLALEAPDEAITPQPGQRTPEVFVFWPVPALDPHQHRALRLHITGSASMVARVSPWLEYHAGGRKQHLDLGRPALFSPPEQKGEHLWLLNRAAMRRAMEDLGPGRFAMYLAVPPIAGSIAVSRVLAMR